MKTICSTQMGSPSPPTRTSTLSSAANYPCPSDVNVADFVSLKLSPTNYFVWKQLMLNFLESRGLVGFVDGTIQPPSLPEGKEKEEDDMSWKEKEEEYISWKRSDNLVWVWISVMVTEKILQIVVRLKTAREVWNELEKMFTLPFQPPVDEFDCKNQEKGKILSQYVLLHKAALNGDWDTATKFLDKDPPEGIRDAITWCSETALMVAVRSAKRNHFVKKLMDKMSREDVAQLDMVGATALHAAVDGNNIEAVKWLVDKNLKLPNIGDKNGTFALHIAAGLGNREMVVYLLKVTKDDEDAKPFEGEPGLRLLNDLASSGLYDIASSFLQSHPNLASMEPSPLVILAAHRSSFRSGTRLNCLQQLIYDGIPLKSEGISNHHKGRDIENPADGVVSPLDLRKKLHGMFWKVVEKLVPPIKSIRETKLIHHQALELVKSLCEGVVKSDFSKAGEIFIAPLRNATCVGIHEVVEEILVSFPSGIHLRSEKDQTIFHLAVIFRREKVFNIIYQLGEGRHRFLSMPDSTTNNTLHSAGNLEPQQQLSLRASAAGAALQMQRELQWFKEVEKLILPQAREHMNAEEKTPLDVFTETHKDLVKEGEKWMKDTANSCTIVAALVATVVFAAAITVPGGTNGDTGLPIFLEDQAFILFGVSDALALFSSTASVLMFLSILTSRYGEQDFLYSLPRRLIIGLVTLFLSIISMMVAFGATLKIVFGDKKWWIVIPVAVLSFVPVALFALLQFPLLLDMIKSTYYPGIFRKQSNRILD